MQPSAALVFNQSQEPKGSSLFPRLIAEQLQACSISLHASNSYHESTLYSNILHIFISILKAALLKQRDMPIPGCFSALKKPAHRCSCRKKTLISDGLHQLRLPELGTQINAYKQNHLNKHNEMSSLSQTKAWLDIFRICIPNYFSAWTINKCKDHRMIHLRYPCLRQDKNHFMFENFPGNSWYL